MSEIQVGDTVQLKSGGPLMTVSEINDRGRAECIWFERMKKHVDWFPAATLTKEDSPGPLGF